MFAATHIVNLNSHFGTGSGPLGHNDNILPERHSVSDIAPYYPLQLRPSSAIGIQSASSSRYIDDEISLPTLSPQTPQRRELRDPQLGRRSSLQRLQESRASLSPRTPRPTNRSNSTTPTQMSSVRSYGPIDENTSIDLEMDHIWEDLDLESITMSPLSQQMGMSPLSQQMSMSPRSSEQDTTPGPVSPDADPEELQAETTQSLHRIWLQRQTSENARAVVNAALSRLIDFRGATLLSQEDLQNFQSGGVPNARKVIHVSPNGIIRPISVPQDVVAAFCYIKSRAPTGSDVWPDIRDQHEAPAVYVPVRMDSSSVPPVMNGSFVWRKSTAATSPKHSASSSESKVTRLPPELLGFIMSYLSRDDIKAMRLTCKEFEAKVSHALFEHVVVPFNTEIYGMLLAQTISINSKAKGKSKVDNSGSMSWQNANNDDIYTGHGINVFKGFGPHIKKYGMSFEVTEAALAKPPLKGTREAHQSYWGEYDWPYQEYQRFVEVAGLENAADETFKMKTAFSYLNGVQELALSIDSGLGYLHGPDMSLRSRIFQSRPPVFGTSRSVPDRKQQARMQLWNALKDAYNGPPNNPNTNLRHATLFHREQDLTRWQWSYLFERYLQSQGVDGPGMPFINLRQVLDRQLSFFEAEELNRDHRPVVTGKSPSLQNYHQLLDILDRSAQGESFYSGLVFAKDDPNEGVEFMNAPVVPANLKKLQREWLLETEWAQRAFLSSYMVAIMDNPIAFQNVHTMSFARLSSRYIPSICRQDFWAALPKLNMVKIHVIPDWRDVSISAGFAETPSILPSLANLSFQKLLSDIIEPIHNVKSLDIGWAAGGEREVGVYSCNKNLMPAPILPYEWSQSIWRGQRDLAQRMICFRHVEHLTLSNCWIPPNALEILVSNHRDRTLKELTLDSVSLTAMLRPDPPAQANNANIPINFPPVLPGFHIPPPGPPIPPPPPGFQVAYFGTWPGGPQPPPLPPPAFLGQMAAPHPLGQHQHPLGQPLPPHHTPLFGGWAPPPPAALPPHVPPSAAAAPAWLGPHREGSWPWVLARVAPRAQPASSSASVGARTPSFEGTAEGTAGGAETQLVRLALRSCGYARIACPRVNQSAVEPPVEPPRAPWFAKREVALAPAMMVPADGLLGEIVQYLPPVEANALVLVFGCVLGWGDEVGEFEREGPTYDGYLEGGAGRFSGVLEAAD